MQISIVDFAVVSNARDRNIKGAFKVFCRQPNVWRWRDGRWKDLIAEKLGMTDSVISLKSESRKHRQAGRSTRKKLTPSLPCPKPCPADIDLPSDEDLPESGSFATLDRMARAALGRYSFGVSPAALSLAFADWGMHLAISPGKQQLLVQKALRKATRFNRNARPAFSRFPKTGAFAARPGSRRPSTPTTRPFCFISSIGTTPRRACAVSPSTTRTWFPSSCARS
jgi:hypothetical protein